MVFMGADRRSVLQETDSDVLDLHVQWQISHVYEGENMIYKGDMIMKPLP